jgi:aspartate aminotransferase
MTDRPSAFLPQDTDSAATAALTPLASNMERSKILHIADQVRGMLAEGIDVCNLTVGDFNPTQFPVPKALIDRTISEFQAGQTNYPPAAGIPELRSAIAGYYERVFGIDFGANSVVVGAGARPVLYASYRLFLEPGDGFAHGVPAWNNHYYVHLNQSRAFPLKGTPESRFLPTAEQITEVLPQIRVLGLNSPLNPTGTAYRSDELLAICEAVLAENRKRESRGQRPVILIYDQVYWTLLAPGVVHTHPLQLVPELAPYVISIDAISKSLAATGLRLGWAVVPPHLAAPMIALVGHMGAWPARPIQRAAAWLYSEGTDVLDQHYVSMGAAVQQRLSCLVRALEGMRADGLPVDLVAPEGGIYLTVRFDLFGRRAPSGEVLHTNEAIRTYLLNAAQIAVVPFQAFGLTTENGWFRMSVGAVDTKALDAAMARLARAISQLTTTV